ncbi:MAG: hypothetical protein FJX59_00070 [Alphaproteobacteria bacterium]|nr:hypothetical protein [Alphaproteobacteria bacterium]
MTQDRSSLHLALFTLALAGSLLAWVEMSLSDVAPPSGRHVARSVAPGLAIVVEGEVSEPQFAARLVEASAESNVVTR